MTTCKDCRWASVIPQDLKQLTCRGAPPQILLAPVKGPLGQPAMTMQLLNPGVGIDNPICSLFKPKPETGRTTWGPWQPPLDKPAENELTFANG